MSVAAVSRLGIGTASFGLDYGVANKTGKVKPDEVFKILTYCQDIGIDLLDTAFTYGDSESVVGECTQRTGAELKIVSKLPPMDTFDGDRVEELLHQSLRRLNKESIYGYLIHRFEDFLRHDELWHVLESLKDKKLVKKIGCSLYKPAELQILLDRNVAIDLVQVPYSVFDRRFESFFEILKRKDVELHVRSVFLQGIVFLDADKELKGNLRKTRFFLDSVQRVAAVMNIPAGAVCLNFALLNRYVDRVVIGVYSLEQLKNDIDYLSSLKDVELDYQMLDGLCTDDEDVLLPYNWRL